MDDITQYRSLGWDFDMTLHGHEKSQQFWDYIHENPHCQTHYIVTFRTGPRVLLVEEDGSTDTEIIELVRVDATTRGREEPVLTH